MNVTNVKEKYNMENKYKYENPLDLGYKSFKLTRKQHNAIFEHRQIRWFDKYEYYYDDKQIILHKFYSFSAVILSTVAFPIGIFINGYSEAKDDLSRMWHQKERGSFISDPVRYKTTKYNKIIDIINHGRK